ncbi:MAG: DUF6284 family protein [Streptomycetales bacterium]
MRREMRARSSWPPASPAGEPSVAELDAIEVGWPVVEAELAALDAEILVLSAAGGPSQLDWRRLRRARRRVLETRRVRSARPFGESGGSAA